MMRDKFLAAVIFLALWGVRLAAEDVSETYFDFDSPEAAQEWTYFWGRGGGGGMEFSAEPVKSGKGSGKLSYAFSKAEDYFVLVCTRPLPDGVQSIKLQVYGDNSGQVLSCRIIDRTGETFLYPLSSGIDWTGWKEFEINVGAPDKCWSGNGDKKIDNPAKLAFDVKGSKACSGSVNIDKITAVSKITDANQIVLRLRSAVPGNIFFAGKDEPLIQAELVNRGRNKREVSLSCRLSASGNLALQKEGVRMEIPGLSVKKADIPLKLQGKPGYYRLDVQVFSGELSLQRESASLAVLEPQVVDASSPFGLNLSLSQRYAPLEMDGAGALAESLGMKWSREEISWENVEAVKGTFHWEKIDRAVELAGRHNIEILGLIGYCAAWARRTPGEHASPPADVNEYANFVGQVVARYKDRIKYWEIWNEPDSKVFWPPKPDAKEYCDLLKAAYQAAKRADPGCHVMTAGLLVGINHRDNWSFLEDMYKGGAKDSFDILAMHAYCDPLSPDEGRYSERLNKLREIMKKNDDGKKPLWLTEEGWPTAPGKPNSVSEKLQADYLVRSHVLALGAPGVEKFFWFLMSDGGNWESDYEQSYGILRSNWTPKPAGVAYAAMTRQLGSAKFAEVVRMKDPARCQVFSSGAESILVMWNSGAGEASLQAEIDKDKILGFSDLYGNAIPPPVDNKFVLTLTGSPVYLKIKTDALAELRAKFASADVAVSMPVVKEPSETKLLDDFEDVDWGRKWHLGWMGSGHEGTVMSSSAEQKHGGRMSGKLMYQADPEKGKYGLCYVEADCEMSLPDESKRIGLWVYGDKSGNVLAVRIHDAGKEIYQYELAKKIDWDGWKYLEADLEKPNSKHGGDGNGTIDFPIAFQGLVVGIVPVRKTEGILYFDGLVVKY